MSPFYKVVLHWEPTLLQDELIITNDIRSDALQTGSEVLGEGDTIQPVTDWEGQILPTHMACFPTCNWTSWPQTLDPEPNSLLPGGAPE